MQTITKATQQLKAGDIVRAHGGRFRLVECRKWASPMHGDRLPPEPVYSWSTECLDPSPVIPRHWLPWTIQGNHLAHWTVEQ